MLSELTSGRLLGLSIAAIFAGALILNAMSY